jgi:hypothetical protein
LIEQTIGEKPNQDNLHSVIRTQLIIGCGGVFYIFEKEKKKKLNKKFKPERAYLEARPLYLYGRSLQPSPSVRDGRLPVVEELRRLIFGNLFVSSPKFYLTKIFF